MSDDEKIARAADLSERQCREIAAMAETNHIWLNAFSCIRPTDELAQSIGYTILAWLDQPDNVMPARAAHDDELAKLTPKLYLSVNKS